jgi:hypothetical protein
MLGLPLLTGCYELTVGKPRDAGPGGNCEPGWAGASCDICVRFVTEGGTGAPDYYSWATAGNSVPEAIQLAEDAVNDGTADPCEVWVAKGTYFIYDISEHDTVQMVSSVNLYGGFSGAGTEYERDQRNPFTNPTALSGHAPAVEGQVFHVVTGSSNATIDGFVIEGGVADGDGDDALGGGMINVGVGPTINNCVFQNNYAAAGGGGMFNQNADPRVHNSRFHANSTGYAGGGLVSDYGTTFVENCTFTANSAASYSGALDIWSDDPENAAFAEVHHSSFANNTSGVTSYGSSTVYLRNCAFAGNEDHEIQATNDGVVQIQRCVVLGGTEDGMIDGDPGFTDPSDGDLSINADSPCIDAADSTYSPPTDIEGSPRVDDPNTDNDGAGEIEYVDIGAYEFQAG